MIVLPPIPVTPAMLISSTASDESAWLETTTYALEAVVSRNHRKWVSLVADNLGKVPEDEPLAWRDDGASNQMAAFDQSPSTVTSAAGGLVMTVALGRRFTDLCLLGIKGRSVTLTLRDGDGGPIFYGPETRSAISVAGSYAAFCFGDLEQLTEMVWSDLPSLNTTHATIEIEATGTAEVALVSFSRSLFIGDAVFGFSNDFVDRSRYYTGSDGNPVTIERGYTKGASGVIEATRDQYNSLIKFSAEYIGVPCIWIVAPGDPSLSGAFTYGRFSSISVGVAGPKRITFRLDISGNV